MRRFGLLMLAFVASLAGATTADLEFSQRLADQLPLETILNDEAGKAVALRDYFGAVPVVLVLGYFECPNLCSTVLDGVVESLGRTGLAVSGYRLLALSIDPREGSPAAYRRLMAYRSALPGMDAHFLTGKGTAGVAAAVGFPYAWDGEHGQYLHPAGFVLATPDGRIARYFLGVRFDAGELRQALVDARAGRTGSLTDRLLLLCSRFEPKNGRYSAAIIAALRIACLLLPAGLGVWIWHRRAGRGG